MASETATKDNIKKQSSDGQDANDSEVGADFETAINESGFGLFNILLLMVALPATMCTVFETSNVSYILASAECDLHLTLLDKGILNAITYAGMISSAIPWGYIADTQGRKRILIVAFLIETVCIIGAATSQNVMQLMIFKYFGGFIACGPSAIILSYLTELHGRNYRSRIMMTVGMMFTTASLTLPILALGILLRTWNFQIFGLNFHPWQMFLAVSAIPSLLSVLLLPFFPESPKFLMSQGRNAEALESFKCIYAINKHKPKDTYPIKRLIEEVPAKESDEIESPQSGIATIEGIKTIPHHSHHSVGFTAGLRQLRPLFMKPYLGLSMLVYLLNTGILLSQNTVRLWLPQLFATINEYEITTGSGGSMCEILEYSVNKTAIVQAKSESECEVMITAGSYTNNIIVSLCGFVGYVVAAILVNRIGGKRILIIALLTAGTAGISLYWSTSSLSTLIASSLFVTMGSISSMSVLNASVSLFPTALRTMIVSLALMFGRCGSLLGNIMFPIAMEWGCIPPFLIISAVMFIACILAIFVPDTKKIELK